jgi:hypothetical protein
MMMIMMTRMVIARQYDHNDDKDADGDNKCSWWSDHAPTAKVHSSSKIGAMRSKWNGALVELLPRRASFNAWRFSL